MKAWKIGCSILIVLAVCAVGIGYVLLNRHVVMMSSPIIYLTAQIAEGAPHEALFLEEGFTDRDWRLFVKHEPTEKPTWISDINLGSSSDFAGAEWSKDGQLLVMSLRSPEIRAFAYDFAKKESIVSPAVHDFLAAPPTSSPGRHGEDFEVKRKEDEAKLKEWGAELATLLDEHGGAAAEMITVETMKQSARKLTYSKYQEFRALMGRE